MIFYILAFIIGGIIGVVFMSIFQLFSKDDKRVEVVYADEPIERLAVRYKEITRPVLDLHYTTAIHREDFERFVDGELQNIVYEGLREQILPALNIEVHKDYRRMEYIIDGSIYLVVAGSGIKEVEHGSNNC